jgi:hypothetical protein
MRRDGHNSNFARTEIDMRRHVGPFFQGACQRPM